MSVLPIGLYSWYSVITLFSVFLLNVKSGSREWILMCTGKLNYMKKVGLKNDGHFEKVYSQKMVQKLSLGRYLL